jgi:hypothetical protein
MYKKRKEELMLKKLNVQILKKIFLHFPLFITHIKYVWVIALLPLPFGQILVFPPDFFLQTPPLI